MEIPAKVREAAHLWTEMYGDCLEYLGEHQGAQAYYYRYPDDVTAGFCPVFLYRDGTVDVLTDEIAQAVTSSLFVEDADESGIE